MSEIIQSVKEFIWDIIGFLIPGFTLIVIFNFVVNPNIAVKNYFIFDWNIFDSILIILISYLLGFVVYGITMFKYRNQDLIISGIKRVFKSKIDKSKKIKTYFSRFIGSKHSQFWKGKFKDSSTVKSARKFLKDNDYQEVEEMKLNEIRNILMSRNPEMDEKIYTFMFRASVFDHLSTILIITCFTALAQKVLHLIGIDYELIKTGGSYTAFYLISILIIPLLGNSKRFFYSISQRIPFSNLK